MGFFSSTIWQAPKYSLPLVPECGVCGLYKGCESPKMPHSGKGKRKVLIFAEAPGRTEDQRGIQLIGNAGMELVRILHNIGVNMRRDCWLSNAVICRPMTAKKEDRTPTSKEIDYCRPNLAKCLKELKPDVIIPLGRPAMESILPLAWKVGERSEIHTWAGWQIPSTRLNAWICPTFHPSYFLHQEREPVLELIMAKHLKAAFLLKGKPWSKCPNFKARVKKILDAEEAARDIRAMMTFGRPLAFDYETNMLRPDSSKAEILCCSVSDGRISIAYPWHGEARKATGEMIHSRIPKIGANLKFEERWTWKEFGHGVKNWHWDTVIGAHWRDCRRGICSTKFQAFVLLGAEDYDSHLKPYKESKQPDSPNRLKEVDLPVLLEYCGLDSLYEWHLAAIQSGRQQESTAIIDQWNSLSEVKSV